MPALGSCRAVVPIGYGSVTPSSSYIQRFKAGKTDARRQKFLKNVGCLGFLAVHGNGKLYQLLCKIRNEVRGRNPKLSQSRMTQITPCRQLCSSACICVHLWLKRQP
jgi:hypothetical protein